MTDIAADISTTGTVAVGGSATGEIEAAGDKDWFAVELVAGRTYRFDLEGAPSGHGTLADTFLRRIMDAQGNKSIGDGQHRTYNDDFEGSRDSQVTFTATESGRYYVEASGDRDETGTYTLMVTDVTPEPVAPQQEDSPPEDGGTPPPAGTVVIVPDEEEEPEDEAPLVSLQQSSDDYAVESTGTTGTVAVGGSATGEIETAGDKDWFAVELVAGRTYRFDLEGAPNGHGTLADTFLRRILDAQGNKSIGDGQHRTYNDDFEGSRDSQVTFTATESGRYYVEASGDRDERGTYTLTVTDVTPEPVAVRQEDSPPQEQQEDSPPEDGGTPPPAGTVVIVPDEEEDPEEEEPLVSLQQSSDDPPDDYPVEGTGTAGRVVVGGSVEGAIDYSCDVDWYAVTLVAGTVYRFDLEGASTGAGTLVNPYFCGISDSRGNKLPFTTDNSDGVGTNSLVQFAPAFGGTYYVRVSVAHEGQMGTYKLSVTDVSAADVQTDGTDTTGVVVVGDSVSGKIDYRRDFDWFKVTLEANTVYRVDLEGGPTGAGTLPDPFLGGVYDSSGKGIYHTSNDNSGTGANSRVTFVTEASGDYYVSAGAFSNFWSPDDFAQPVGTYKLSVAKVEVDDDYAAGTGTTGTVEVNGSVRGRIDYANDQDWYAVTLKAGATYRIVQEYSASTVFLGDVHFLGVHDSSGNLIPDTDDSRWSSRHKKSEVVFQATEDGIHYLSAGTGHKNSANYELSVTQISAADQQTADTETTGTVEMDGSVTGEIEFEGDRDWFEVTLEAGTTYRIDLDGASTRDGTLRDPYLDGIYNSVATLVGMPNNNNGTGLNSETTFKPTEGGTYYVSAGAIGSGTGTYKLSVTNASAADTLSAGLDTTGTVEVDGSVRGEIDFKGDRDWYAIELEADTTYRIDLEGAPTGAGTLRDPNLRGIHDSTGTLLDGTANDDGGEGRNSRVTFEAPEGGTYYVSASVYGFGTGTYTLSVEEVM